MDWDHSALGNERSSLQNCGMTQETIARLRISLNDIEPEIWRTVEMPVTGSLKMPRRNTSRYGVAGLSSNRSIGDNLMRGRVVLGLPRSHASDFASSEINEALADISRDRSAHSVNEARYPRLGQPGIFPPCPAKV